MGIGACCFPTGACENLERQDCIDGGGLPYPDSESTHPTSCGRQGFPDTFVIECNKGACCEEDDGEGNPARCLDVTPEFCNDFGNSFQGRGTFCADRSGGSREVFDYPCERGFEQDVRCCLADGTTNTTISEDQCHFIGGRPVGSDETCDLPPDEQCRTALPDRVVPGTSRWSLDVCNNVALEPVMRPPAHRTGAGGLSPLGYFDLFTMRKARAMSVDCKHYYAEMTIGDDGYGQPLMCSNNGIGGRTEFHAGTAMLATDDELTKKGYAMFVSAYHAPMWTEVMFDSAAIRCGEVAR